MKKTISIDVTIRYKVEIDEDNDIVKEYSDQGELIEDLAGYRFSNVLPVMKDGVKILDIATISWNPLK